MKTRIATTFGLTLMLVLGALGSLLALGVFDAKSVYATAPTTVRGEANPSDPGAVTKLSQSGTTTQTP